MKCIIVHAAYYEKIAKLLQNAAESELDQCKARYPNLEWDTLYVPGALEIPGVIAALHRDQPNVFFVALGCVIRGETSHYDVVVAQANRGIMDLTLQGVAIGNGVLTVENEKQALVRADFSQKNHGGHAVSAAMALAEIYFLNSVKFSNKG